MSDEQLHPNDPAVTEAPASGEEAQEEQPVPRAGRIEFDEEQQREVQRIVRREVEAARRKAAAEAQTLKERQEAEARGEYQKLLAQVERERDEARMAMRQVEAERAVEQAARKLAAEHPEVIYKLVRDEIEFDDAGRARNAEDLVARLKKEYPRYFLPAPVAAPGNGADGGKKGGDKATGGDMDAILRRAAGR